jgi:cytochrome c6
MLFSVALAKKLVLPALALAALVVSPALSVKGAETGEATFKRLCAGCHGPDGAGATAMGRTFKLKDLRSPEVQSLSDAQLVEIVTHGKGKMPPYGTRLNSEEIHSVVKHLRELAKKK